MILSSGSDSVVRYAMGRVSGRALANTSCCASTVLPTPGSPTTRLIELDGKPPPRMRSSSWLPVEMRIRSSIDGPSGLELAAQRGGRRGDEVGFGDRLAHEAVGAGLEGPGLGRQ